MTKQLIEIMGWYGTVAIIGAYAGSSFGMLSSSSMTYQLINLTGALGIVFVSLSKKAYQPATLNIVWTGIALIALARMLLRV